VCENDADAVSDRDFAAEFCAACALLMVHLSRFCEELIWWMNPAFGALAAGDSFCTGSSVMPQKKNPDAAELIRGKCGRVFGALIAQLTIAKAQPLAYNRDNQEDKEPLFDCYDTARECAAIFAAMIKTLRADKSRLRSLAESGFSTATELADYLTRKGVAFRDAHAAAAAAVFRAERDGKKLSDLDLKTLRAFSPKIAADVYDSLSIEGAIASRKNPGGCAPSQVKAAIAAARAELRHKNPQAPQTSP
jgi:argininosuccinate lyase